MKKVNLKQKTVFLLNESLKEMPLESYMVIREKQFKPSVVRNTAQRLKAEGYLFEVSERGLIGAVKVIRKQ